MNKKFNTKLLYILLTISVLMIGCPEPPPPTNNCNGEICLDNQKCVEVDGKESCQCNEGYDLINDKCEKNKCFDFKCAENEKCTILNEEASCECKDGFQLENNICTKIPTECNEITCKANEKCVVEAGSPSCECNDKFYKKNDICIFDCRDIEGAEANLDNTNCECSSSNYYINEEEKKCLVKEGCKLDGIDCGNGTCKEDLEKDWSCDCNEGYYFDGTTCLEESKCEENQMECSGVATGCCPTNQICLNDNSCYIVPVDTCQNDNECVESHFCDPVAEKCIKMDDDNGCIFRPPYTENMTPLLAWQWPGDQTIDTPSHNQVMMAPMVANITDDNNDGVVNLKDIPDVIFTTFGNGNYHGDGIIRILDGKTGLELLTTSALSRVASGYEIAVGDIDNDGQNEIIASKDVSGRTGPHPIIAFRYNLTSQQMEEVWTAANESSNRPAPAIADLDHDGNPEVISQNYVLNGEDGTTQCAFPAAVSRFFLVEDANNDGIMDVIGGNAIYSGSDCSLVSTTGTGTSTAYLAMADLDKDGTPEIVTVSNNTINIFDLQLMPKIPPFIIGDSSRGGGGPPTIANFDTNNNDLEIAVAGEDYYSVTKVNFNAAGTAEDPKAWFLWTKLTEDHSSKSTGSSLFDFEGDGIAEVLYADQCYFRIYNGEDGSERFKTINSNGTLNEYPIVVDVDNDGKSEIIVGSNDFAPGSFHTNCDWYGIENPTNGIRMFESANNTWVRTRRIWNQHTYHVTNINEDGSVPVNEEHNWETYNNYRLNVQGKGVFNSPNFVIDRFEVERTDCPELNFKFKIKLSNKGSLSIPVGIPVSIYKNEGSNKVLIATIFTTEILLPGSSTSLEYTFTPQDTDKSYSITAVADDKGNNSGEYNECNEIDNSKTISFKGSYTLFCQAGVGECMKFAPFVCNENNELTCGAIANDPIDEICDDGFDNNCDGNIDENCSCNTQEQDCYHASSDLLAENSRCKKGKMYCIGGESWGTCENDILPIVETCNGEDDDCDGSIDEDFPQLGELCYLGFGICKQSGNFICHESGNMVCSATPTQAGLEICDDNLDNNCNGVADEKPCQKQE